MSQIARFEALCRRAAVLGAEVRLVPMINQYYGDVEFYAHILDHDSDTVDVSIANGPALVFLELQRGASGLRGSVAEAISKEAETYTREPLVAAEGSVGDTDRKADG